MTSTDSAAKAPAKDPWDLPDVSGLVVGVLGALLTFSPHVWYPIYDRSAATAGLTPLEDQQLAGLLMWVPAGVTFVAGGLYFFAAWLKESERRVLHAAR